MDFGTTKLVFDFPLESHGVEGLSDALMQIDACDRVSGTPDSLRATFEIGGNVSPLSNLASVVRDVEETANHVGYEPRAFTVTAVTALWEPQV